MPGFIYDEEDVIERKRGVHISTNGVVSAGAKYIGKVGKEVRIDVIIVKIKSKPEVIRTETEETEVGNIKITKKKRVTTKRQVRGA